jgi:hypothetical protein
LSLGIVSAGIAYGVDFLMAEEPPQGIPNSVLSKDKKDKSFAKKIIFTTSNKYFSYAMLAF